MYNFSSLQNRPVLSKKDLCIIGNIEDCIFREKLNRIAYFLCINKSNRFLIPIESLSSINDAIVVDDTVNICHAEDIDFTTVFSIIDKSVYKDNGTLCGTVKDFVFDLSGKITDIMLDDGTMKINDVAGVGDIILLKPPTKKSKKAKKVNLIALATEENPVYTLDEENQHNVIERGDIDIVPHTHIENSKPTATDTDTTSVPITSAVLSQGDLQVATQNAQVPPRIISDYNFLLGRNITKDLYTHNGELIAYSNTPVTVPIVDKARLSGKLLELTLNSK